jgi:hypothetical protein
MNNTVINDYLNSILEDYKTNYDDLLTIPKLIDASIEKNNIFYNTLLLSELDIFTNKSFTKKQYINRHALEIYRAQKIAYNKYYTTIVNNNEHNCCICLETINQYEHVYNLNCGGTDQPHIYHKSCFEKWNKNSCPYCRTQFIVK